MAKITGRVEVVANGNLLLNKAGAVASGIGISGEIAVQRNPILGDSGLHGSVEENIVAQLEVTVTDRDDISISDLASINGDGTIIFRAAGTGGGKVYTMNNATCQSNISITAGEGETTLVFFGASWTEDTSAT